MCRLVGGRQDILKYEDTRRKMQRDARGLEIKFYRCRDGRRRHLRKSRPTPTTTHSRELETERTGNYSHSRNQFSTEMQIVRSPRRAWEICEKTFEHNTARQRARCNFERLIPRLVIKNFCSLAESRELTKKVAGGLV